MSKKYLKNLLTLWYYGIIISLMNGGVTIKAVSIRMSDNLHKALKYKLIEDDKSIQQYIIELIKRDLDFKDEDDDLSDYLPKEK